MKNIFISTGLLLYVFIAGSKSFAQTDSLSAEDRIRLTAPKYFYQPVIGKFEKLHSDSLFIRLNTRSIATPIRDIGKIELSTGEERHTLTGAIAGSVIGGLVLGVFMHAEEREAAGFSVTGQPGFWGGFASGALLGGGVGALIGSNIRSDSWKEIALKSQTEKAGN